MINKFQLKILGIIGAILTLMVPFFLLFFDQGEHLDTDQSLCPLKMLTGFPCPSCGITKSMVYLYEGDLQKSLYFHLLGPMLIVFCVGIIVVLAAKRVTKKEFFSKVLFTKKLGYRLAVILAIYHLIRLVYFVHTHSIEAILKESIWR